MAVNKKREIEVPRTGLYWPGKRTQVERIALPFQVVETINVSRATREEAPLLAGIPPDPLFERPSAEEQSGWRNKLIWGENKYIMSSLLPEFAGKINLIYIDPPFATGADFSINMKVGDEEWVKEASVIEEKAYRDTWGKGLDSYLQIMYDRLVLMRELLANDGSIYVHLDWHVGHYAKLLMDEIFGKEDFQNEIIWYYPDKFATGGAKLDHNHDTLLHYSKTEEYIASKVMEPKEEPTRRALRKKVAGKTLDVLDEKGQKIWVTYSEKKIDDVWRIGRTKSSQEQLPFPTQKPEDLLRRVLLYSSNPGDLVADFFCGSGTTGAVAEKLGRRWIMADLSRFAVQVTRKRLLDIPGCKPFEILNLGKYERQYWQVHVNGQGAKADEVVLRYFDFIIQLYRGEGVSGFTHLHGRKAGRMVHVGAVDAPVTLSEIRDALDECAANRFRGLDVLGWEWEMGLHDLVTVEARKRGVDLRLLTIPREVMDPRAVEAGDIDFYELAYLDVAAERKGLEVQVALKNFVIPNEDLVPEEVRKKIKRWSDYVDFWAVDWEFQGDTFHNQWQSYRTRKNPNLRLDSDWQKYSKPGKYQVMVKVIDIFGNDTSKLLSVEVR